MMTSKRLLWTIQAITNRGANWWFDLDGAAWNHSPSRLFRRPGPDNASPAYRASEVWDGFRMSPEAAHEIPERHH
jgi:hypothetical protein